MSLDDHVYVVHDTAPDLHHSLVITLDVQGDHKFHLDGVEIDPASGNPFGKIQPSRELQELAVRMIQLFEAQGVLNEVKDSSALPSPPPVSAEDIEQDLAALQNCICPRPGCPVH